MATRKRATRRPAKKVANSKIAEAQKAATAATKKTAEPKPAKKAAKKAPPKPSRFDPTKLQGTGEATPRDPLLQGLTTGFDAKTYQAMNAGRPKNPVANPALYGKSSTKDRAQALSDRLVAMDASIQQQKQKGNAVYMGLDPKESRTVKIRRSGPERMDEDGTTTEEQKVGDLVLTKDELMSWLTDEAKVAEIKAAAQKAGLSVDTYDDVAKIWTSVVSQAASSYSITNKKVTPWALLTLRGKYMGADGKPKDRTVTSTNIDEMDPATARLMFEKTAQAQLGRAPTKQEVDDFIAKAQTIALKNPAVTTTTQKIGFDGNVESQVSRTRGGAQAVSDQAEVAAMDKARQSEDYSAYQAAGNYFPMLFEALGSPV